MSDIKLIINGKEYICRPTEESESPRTGYERVEEEKNYYRVIDWYWSMLTEQSDKADNDYYEKGNYFNDTQLAEDIARAETLMRRMRQWQALNDKPVNWRRAHRHKHYIFFDSYNNTLKIDSHDAYRDFGQIYFFSHEKAFEALEVFHDELMWYFTEYRQRLDEPRV